MLACYNNSFSLQYDYKSTTEEEKTVSLEIVWNGNFLVDDDFGTEGK